MSKDTQILTNLARFKFSEEKDEFRGSLKVDSSWVYISRNSKGDVLSYLLLDNELKDIFHWSSFDLFSLSYIELEGGTGKLIFNILSKAKFKSLDDPDVLPKWYDDFLMIVDGQRIAFEQFGKRETGDSYELIKYSILVEDLSKITNASEIKFSLRGENHTIEGNFVDAHIKIFKAFEQYCFGDKDVANEIISKINQELDEKSEKLKQIEEKKKLQQETKSKEKIQTYLETTKKNRRTKSRNILIIVIILISIAVYQNFKKSKDSSSSDSSASTQKVFINDKPGSYLVSEQIAGGAVLLNVDKKTKKTKKLSELARVSILKVEDSLGYFDTYYGDEGKISAGWVNMKNLVPSDGYLTYSYGEKFWVKSDLSQVVTYKDYFKEKPNKKKLKGMDEIQVYLIKDGLAYFNNGILDDYFKGWIEADKIEEKK